MQEPESQLCQVILSAVEQHGLVDGDSLKCEGFDSNQIFDQTYMLSRAEMLDMVIEINIEGDLFHWEIVQIKPLGKGFLELLRDPNAINEVRQYDLPRKRFLGAD